MQHRSTFVMAGLALAALAGTASAKSSSTLKMKAFKNFKYVMPADVWVDVGMEVPLKNPKGTGFRAIRDGLKLSVDTNGDGRADEEVKGASGFLTFRCSEGDEDFRYAARFAGSSSGFKMAVGGAMCGKVDGIKLMVFDLNCNGVYGEAGKDALIVGRSKAASYFSKVISHKGTLYTLEVSENGQSATVAPYEGPAGTLSLAKGHSARGRLEAAVVQDEQGNSFELAGERSGMKIPEGNYKIVSGYITKGSRSVRIRAGKMQPIQVKAGTEVEFEWGAPVKARIEFSYDGQEVKVDPKQVAYYGKGGEEYFDWQPVQKSPKFTVFESETMRELGGFQYTAC